MKAPAWLGLCCVACVLTCAAREPIALYYIERPPFASTTPGNTVSGLTADVAVQAFRKAGLPYQWQLLPFRRQLWMLEKNQSRACSVGLFKTADRLRVARYSLPIYRDRFQVAVARINDARIPDSIDARKLLALRGIKLLLKDGFSYGPLFDQLIASSRPESVRTFDEVAEMLQLIQLGGADYTFLPVEEATLHLASGRFAGLRQVNLSDAPQGERRYILCTLQVSADDMRVLNQAIKHLKLPFDDS